MDLMILFGIQLNNIAKFVLLHVILAIDLLLRDALLVIQDLALYGHMEFVMNFVLQGILIAAPSVTKTRLT